MSSEENTSRNRAPHGGGWQPIPQGGEYDAEATAFVQLPPEAEMDIPLAAPGHGYVPPQIPPVTPEAAADPAATGAWTVSQQGAPQASHDPRVHDPRALDPRAHDPRAHDPRATGQWTFPEAVDPSAGPAEPSPEAGSDLTGQWTIPVAQGDIPEESGEFTTSALASQWGGGTPPATLPGGATAPWATTPDGGTPAAGTPLPEPVPEVPYPATLPGGAPAPWATEGPVGGDAVPAPEQQGEPAVPGARSGEPRPDTPEATRPADPAEHAESVEPVSAEAVVPDAGAVADEGADTSAEPSAAQSDEHPHSSYVLRVNGADRPVTDAWIGESLLYVLRERLGLAGAKDGCSQGECGACNVQVDGRLVASCLVPAATAAGSEVRTVEGLAADGEPSDVQRALAKCGAVQCGFCIPGMAMTVHDLLEGNHAPTELETRQALCGNLCRCSGYRGVIDAVSEVVAEREASAAAAAEAVEEARGGNRDGAHDGTHEGTHEGARIPHQAPPGAGSVQPHPHDGGMV
ncbi:MULTISPECIES: 2Fe-2S iron-sulfur cluster-binding protein [unclassified Streptomyces]|uniref:2Fe-2S iron-sulfur cluster-binding protein n=1 Tax=Streptomyces sp. NPDC006678 TaxID=3157185 RepID=UPI0033FC0892